MNSATDEQIFYKKRIAQIRIHLKKTFRFLMDLADICIADLIGKTQMVDKQTNLSVMETGTTGASTGVAVVFTKNI
jgi:hypothetical protein